MRPSIDIQLGNGGIGSLPVVADGVCGLILQGIAASGLALSTANVVTSLAQAEAKGLTAAYDTTNSCRVYAAIKEFYATAGEGAELWLWLVSKTLTVEQVFDVANNHAKGLLNAANGRIRLLGMVRSPDVGYTPNITANKIDLDIINALPKAQALATQFATGYKPVRILLEAYAYTGDEAGLKDLKTYTHNRVALVLGRSSDMPIANALVPTALGRLSRIPVQRKLARVRDGALPLSSGLLYNKTVEELGAILDTVHDKGYITLTNYVDKSGYYFTDDPTATAATDDYNTIARGRVIDKAIRIAYAVYIEEIQDEIELDAAGKMEGAKATYYESILNRAIGTAMVAEKEISAVVTKVDPNQNVLATDKFTVGIEITSVAYAKNIKITLGF